VEEKTVMICVVLSVIACDVDLTNLRALVSSTPDVNDDVLVQAIKQVGDVVIY
jgi:hypothetical protein